MPCVLLEPAAQLRRQLAESGANVLDFVGRDGHWHQVGIGEVAIVARFFLMPLAARDVGHVVPAAGLLGHVAELLAGLLPDLRIAARLRSPWPRSTARKLFMFLTSTIGVAIRSPACRSAD